MVERLSRYTLIALAASKEASVVGDAILSAMHPHREKVLTMTYDNGKEFAHPYHSWERGLNENTNGFVRQYFRKGSCFAELTDEDVALV